MAQPISVLYVVSSAQEASLGDTMVLARWLSGRGQTVTVAGDLTRPTRERLSEAKARWVSLSLPTDADISPWLHLARQLRRLIQSISPDIVHAHGMLPGAATAVALRGLRLPPRLVISLPDLHTLRLPPMMRLLTRWALKRAQRLTVGTAADMDALRLRNRGVVERARLIHHAVQLRPTRGDFDVGLKRRALGLNLHSAVIGVISPAIANLGLITFLEAAAKISQGYPNVEFLLVGDGVDQERLSLLAHDLGIGGATIFRGTRTDVPEIIGSLNTLVIPHDIPGAVGLALQAVIQEIPVVAVRTAALTEVLADVCPEALVNPEDAEALVKGVARNLELLPPPEADAGVFVDGGITLSYSDLLVAQESYDLDTAGLEVETRELSPVRRAARQAQARYSPTALVRATESLYAEILTTGAERLVPQVRHL